MSDVAEWWQTSIIDMEPGRISIRGHEIQDLIGNLSFAEMVWLMLCGVKPEAGQARLLEAALVASVDHGPQAPSIAAARMAVTCGLGLNGAMGTAVHMLDDVHGGAGEQLVEWLHRLVGGGQESNLGTQITAYQTDINKFIPGFGHRFHKPEDPRAPRLMALVREARDDGVVSGKFMELAMAIERHLAKKKGKPVPMNIDGATAVIFAELGFAPPLARGLFCLSRSVGAMAHGYEQMQQGGRNKGPTPPHYRWRYSGKD
ncbi:MAG TPA: citryl-CoA lyase [Alphaproteobacteria bacterium]|nr:citryl-CoA lyase [Alphaproteobacteria bacterium]|tara:strand:+ start:986 stop:1762 length:777 start_codon:yes stop_codon:yes gene_type:complete